MPYEAATSLVVTLLHAWPVKVAALRHARLAHGWWSHCCLPLEWEQQRQTRHQAQGWRSCCCVAWSSDSNGTRGWHRDGGGHASAPPLELPAMACMAGTQLVVMPVLLAASGCYGASCCPAGCRQQHCHPTRIHTCEVPCCIAAWWMPAFTNPKPCAQQRLARPLPCALHLLLLPLPRRWRSIS
jgi:hypothetical protein